MHRFVPLLKRQEKRKAAARSEKRDEGGKTNEKEDPCNPPGRSECKSKEGGQGFEVPDN